uniref:Uncharacterized protein n=1 Tax=biofilter metagenome TaxID=1070537 RepID=A0A193SBU9_9ZZZZ
MRFAICQQADIGASGGILVEVVAYRLHHALAQPLALMGGKDGNVRDLVEAPAIANHPAHPHGIALVQHLYGEQAGRQPSGGRLLGLGAEAGFAAQCQVGLDRWGGQDQAVFVTFAHAMRPAMRLSWRHCRRHGCAAKPPRSARAVIACPVGPQAEAGAQQGGQGHCGEVAQQGAGGTDANGHFPGMQQRMPRQPEGSAPPCRQAGRSVQGAHDECRTDQAIHQPDVADEVRVVQAGVDHPGYPGIPGDGVSQHEHAVGCGEHT